jgi:hypothetical protein
MAREELSADKVIAKIHELKGNLSMVARSFSISRQTLYNYMKQRPSVQAAVEEARETMIDNVESALYSAALKGEAWAVCFFLKTQGKSRGYVERQEVTGKDGAPMRLTIDWSGDDNGNDHPG